MNGQRLLGYIKYFCLLRALQSVKMTTSHWLVTMETDRKECINSPASNHDERMLTSIYTFWLPNHDLRVPVWCWHDATWSYHNWIRSQEMYKLPGIISWRDHDQISTTIFITKSWFYCARVMLSWCNMILSRFQPHENILNHA